MTRRFLITALVVSVLFNVGFIIGRTQLQPGGLTSEANADTVELVAKELDLSPEQRLELVELRRGFADDWEELQAEATLVRQELAELFAAEEPDMDRIEELFNQARDVERQIHQVASVKFREFAARLKPEQRERLGRMMGRHRPQPFNGHDPRQRMMREFDANKDGELDESEKAKARSRFEEMRGRRSDSSDERYRRDGGFGRERGDDRGDPDSPPWGDERGQRGERRYDQQRMGAEMIRGMLLHRFDANGDGIVDEVEAQSLVDWLASEPGEGPPPPPRSEPDPERQPGG